MRARLPEGAPARPTSGSSSSPTSRGWATPPSTPPAGRRSAARTACPTTSTLGRPGLHRQHQPGRAVHDPRRRHPDHGARGSAADGDGPQHRLRERARRLGPAGRCPRRPTVALTTDESHSPTHAALVSDRTSQGDGIGHDVTGLMNPGTTYEFTAWVKFAAGNPTDTLWLSMRRTNGGADSFDTLGQFTAVSGTAFVEVSGDVTRWAAGRLGVPVLRDAATRTGPATRPFLVDDIRSSPRRRRSSRTCTPVKDTVDFPVGGAIDSRETDRRLVGAPAPALRPGHAREPHEARGLVRRGPRLPDPTPRPTRSWTSRRTTASRVYGHTLVWHSQTPAWFFQHDDGTPLTDERRRPGAPAGRGCTTTSSTWPST